MSAHIIQGPSIVIDLACILNKINIMGLPKGGGRMFWRKEKEEKDSGGGSFQASGSGAVKPQSEKVGSPKEQMKKRISRPVRRSFAGIPTVQKT